MPIEILTTTESLHTLEPQWTALWQADRRATPFQSPHWLMPWWKHFGGSEPYVVTQWHDGQLVGLAPLYILRDEDSDESLGMWIGAGISDYLDLLTTTGADVQELIAAAGKADCQMWDLQQIPPSSPLLTAAAPDSWSDSLEDQEACPALSIAGAGPGLENILSTHSRKKLRYARRSLERLGAVTHETATEENLDDLLTVLFDLHAARWKRRGLPGVLADDVTQHFHREVARRMLGASALRLFAIRLAGRPVAVFYGFAHQGTTCYYLSGYDPELEKLSIGTIAVAHAIESAVAEGQSTFDFLRGAEEYKYSWGAVDRMNRHRVWIHEA
jgi:CelD/BcsL family acetyltransferase involved in cellulose biosynthesis